MDTNKSKKIIIADINELFSKILFSLLELRIICSYIAIEYYSRNTIPNYIYIGEKMNFKKVLSLFMIIMMLAVIGCKEDDDNPASSNESALVGTWVLTSITLTSINNTVLTPEQAGMNGTIIMNANKTFDATFTQDGVPDNETGTWSVSGTTLTLTGETETIVLENYTLQNNKLYVNTTINVDPFGELPVKLEFTKQ